MKETSLYRTAIEEIIVEEGEQAAADEIIGSQQDVAMLQACYDLFEDDRILFNLIKRVYVHHGYGFPKKPIMRMKKASKSIPESERLAGLPDGDPVTIYRSTVWWHDAGMVKNEISWTPEKNIAIWFASRFKDVESKPKCCLWKAEIDRDKIIAYTNDRNEYEVIQHGNVKNLEKLPDPTDEEIKEAVVSMCNLTMGIYERGLEQGLEQGRILMLIEICCDEKKMEDKEIVGQLQKRFQITKEEAEDYLAHNNQEKKG